VQCQQCMHARACCPHFHLARRAPRSCCACVTPHGSGVDLCTHAAVRCDTQGRLTQGSTVVHTCKHRHLSECDRHTWQSVTGTRTGTWQSGRVCPSHAFGRVCPAHAQALGRVCPAHAQALGRVSPVQAQALGRVCPASAKPRFCPILTPSQHPNRFSRSCLREHGDRHRVTMAVPHTACTVRTGCTPQARRVPLSRSTRTRRRTQSRRVPLTRSTRMSRRSQSHRVPLGRSTQTSRKLHAHAPAPCASRGTDPRARCRAALQCTSRGTAREPGVRIARHRPGVVCRAVCRGPACAARPCRVPACARRGARAC